MKRVALLCRLLLAAVFLVAAVPKILAPHEFALAVFRYQLVPYPLVNLMGIYLPWLEFVAGLAILTPRFREAAAAILLGLLAIFTTAITINLVRGIDVSCGCFTVDPDAGPLNWWEVVRDVALMAAALAAWRLPPGNMDRRARPGSS